VVDERSYTGWQRCIVCLQLQVSFACKRANEYRALLWEMNYKDKTSYVSLPPCIAALLERSCVWV